MLLDSRGSSGGRAAVTKVPVVNDVEEQEEAVAKLAEGQQPLIKATCRRHHVQSNEAEGFHGVEKRTWEWVKSDAVNATATSQR